MIMSDQVPSAAGVMMSSTRFPKTGMVVCVLGSVSSGKTVLIKRIKGEAIQENTRIIPTVGIDHVDVPLQSLAISKENEREKKTKKKGVNCMTLLELGGELAQNWLDYIKSKNVLVYVIDISNLAIIGEVAFHFLQCIQAMRDSKSTKVLIVYSKVDKVPGTELERRLEQFRSLVRTTHIIDYFGKIDFAEVHYSALSNCGLPQIKDWIRRNGM